MHDQPTTPVSKYGSSDHDDTEDEEYLSCILEWLGLDPDS